MYLGVIVVPSSRVPPSRYVTTAHGDSCQCGGRGCASALASASSSSAYSSSGAVRTGPASLVIELLPRPVLPRRAARKQSRSTRSSRTPSSGRQGQHADGLRHLAEDHRVERACQAAQRRRLVPADPPLREQRRDGIGHRDPHARHGAGNASKAARATGVSTCSTDPACGELQQVRRASARRRGRARAPRRPGDLPSGSRAGGWRPGRPGQEDRTQLCARPPVRPGAPPAPARPTTGAASRRRPGAGRGRRGRYPGSAAAMPSRAQLGGTGATRAISKRSCPACR